MSKTIPLHGLPSAGLDLADLADATDADRDRFNEPNSTATIRVMHVINGEHYSGAERVQDLLAACLPGEGFEVGFACIKPDRFPATRQSKNAPLFELPQKSKFDLRVAWRLAKILRRDGYRLVHAHTPRSALVANVASRLAGLPMVYHVHSPTSRDSTRWFHNKMNTLVERLSISRASRLITVSSSLGRHMREQGFAADRVAVVPNGVPTTDRRRSGERPGTTWTLGAVALFRPRKGTEVLLDALSILRAQGHDVRLRAVGPFETKQYEDALKRQAAELRIEDFIDWTGFTTDVNSELARMDLFVLPSLFGEGLPMVVLEAMAAGVPVIGTNVEGVPEAIRDGIDGMIAAPRDPQDLARVISQVISGDVPWRELRENAIQRHAQSFSDQSMAAGVAAVYRQVLNRD